MVGPSGSGKTLTALALLGLLPKDVSLAAGEIWFAERNLCVDPGKALRSVRGREISIIFQDPQPALNPVFRVGDQIFDVVKTHLSLNSTQAKERILALFERTGLADPAQVYMSYPHQLSGGIAQRVMIAMALSCGPKLLIADEPTTALDVVTQMQILSLLRKLQQEQKIAMLVISHDLQVVQMLAESLLVMENGQIVESGNTADLLRNPQNQCTRRLVDSMLAIPTEGSATEPGQVAIAAPA